MSQLVTDCPRCNAKHTTFDVKAQKYVGTHRFDWRVMYETFCICRTCHVSTVFVLYLTEYKHQELAANLTSYSRSINDFMTVDGYISLKNFSTSTPPDHLPENIAEIFREGATCFAVKCFNASATMFRLCLDLATKPLLPQPDQEPKSQVRRNLGLRLPWLFEKGMLPKELKELSSCVKDDGNDGAHDGNLKKEDAQDLLEFTYEFLERLYTEPERLRLAKERREQRRASTSIQIQG